MAKVDLIRDLLVKITKFYPDDLCILKNKFVIPGKKSADRLISSDALVILEENIKQEYDSYLSNLCDNLDKMIVINSIKDAKKNYGEFFDIEDVDNELFDKLSILYDKYMKVDEWFGFKELATHEELDTFFKESGSINLFNDDEDVASVLVSKSSFPLISEKTCANYYLSKPKLINKDERIWTSYCKVIHPYFIGYYTFSILS